MVADPGSGPVGKTAGFGPVGMTATFAAQPKPMVTPWDPRSKDGRSRWLAEIDDLLVFEGLLEASRGPPTLEECATRFPHNSQAELQSILCKVLLAVLVGQGRQMHLLHEMSLRERRLLRGSRVDRKGWCCVDCLQKLMQ